MPQNKEIIVSKDKSYYRNMAILLPFLLYLGGSRAYQALQANGIDWLSMNLWLLISLITLVVLIRVLRRWLDREPGLVIKKEGIVDNVSLVQAGLIPWSSITSAEVKTYAGASQFMIHIDQGDRYLKGLSYVNGKMAQQMITDEGTPIIINTKFIKYNGEQLAKVINERLRKHRSKR